MFNKIFVENEIKELAKTQEIVNKFKGATLSYIENYQDVWGRVKKPYLQKRTNLNLFLASKKGQLIKEAPDAYGLGPEKHFYFIHAFNCIYECQYCYLQGYFNTPDIVLFINHDDIIKEMTAIVKDHPDAWFHAGEFSDSLALSNITGELPIYFEFFNNHPKAKLELRTKSANIRPLLELDALANVFTSFTLSSHKAGEIFDTKCPSVSHRLNSINKLVSNGHMIGIHFDPLIYQVDFELQYQDIIKELKDVLPDSNLGYISIGVVRFTKDVHREVERNYPKTKMLGQDFTKSFDGKMRYNKPMRMWMMQKVKAYLIDAGYAKEKIYFCMEEN